MEVMSYYVNAPILKEANNAIEDLIIEHRDFVNTANAVNKEPMVDISNTADNSSISREYEILKKVTFYLTQAYREQQTMKTCGSDT